MVKTLNSVLFFIASMVSQSITADTLRDPTQPPAGFSSSHPNSAVDVGDSGMPGRVLQSIIRRHGAKSVAMINGQSVRLGEKIDDFVLVKLTETQATLKGPAGTEVLVMSPSVDKKTLRPVRAVR